MRRKIKELMNKEEGFTLVELLAVIVILGIIVAIAIPAIGSVINRAQGDATEAEQSLVADAARLYVTTAKEGEIEWKEGTGTDTATIDVTEDLYDKGYLEKRDGKELTGKVKVTRKAIPDETGLFTYEYNAEDVKKATTEEGGDA